MGKPRLIRVEIGSLVLDDRELARPVEIASAVERELARLAASGRIGGVMRGRRVSEVSLSLRRPPSTDMVGRAIAGAVGGELES